MLNSEQFVNVFLKKVSVTILRQNYINELYSYATNAVMLS